MPQRPRLSAPVWSLIAIAIVVMAFLFTLWPEDGVWDGPGRRQPPQSRAERELAVARDAQRRADVSVILNAVHEYAINHGGAFPAGIGATPAEVCGTIREADGSYQSVPMDDCVDLWPSIREYVTRLPADPQAPAGRTWYRISRSADGRLTVMAENYDGEAAIAVTR